MANNVAVLKGVAYAVGLANVLLLALLCLLVCGVVSDWPHPNGLDVAKPCSCNGAADGQSSGSQPAAGAGEVRKKPWAAPPPARIIMLLSPDTNKPGSNGGSNGAVSVDSNTLLSIRNDLREIADGFFVPIEVDVQSGGSIEQEVLGEIGDQVEALSQLLAKLDQDRNPQLNSTADGGKDDAETDQE